MITLGEMGVHAKKASGNLARTTSGVKNNAINHLAVLLAAKEAEILVANEKDNTAGVKAGLSEALLEGNHFLEQEYLSKKVVLFHLFENYYQCCLFMRQSKRQEEIRINIYTDRIGKLCSLVSPAESNKITQA